MAQLPLGQIVKHIALILGRIQSLFQQKSAVLFRDARIMPRGDVGSPLRLHGFH